MQLAVAHYQFEVIHPFLDGNGRIGRLMIPLMLVLRDALPQPLLYLSAYFEQHRSEYYDHLLITSQQGDLMPWIAFFLRGVRQQARDSEERTVRLVELQHQLRNDLLDEGRPNSVVRLAEQLFAIPVVTAARVESMIGVTRPTAQAAIDALVERGDLPEITGRARDASTKPQRSSKRCTAQSTSRSPPSIPSSLSGSPTRSCRNQADAEAAKRAVEPRQYLGRQVP